MSAAGDSLPIGVLQQGGFRNDDDDDDNVDVAVDNDEDDVIS